MKPSELLQVPGIDLAQARSLLLRTEYIDSVGWKTSNEEPQASDVERTAAVAPVQFAAHEKIKIPDSPPIEGACSTTVHRFVYAAAAAARLNTELVREAHRQNSWPRNFAGVSISNIDGFHSREEAFQRKGHRGRWYSALMSDVLLPALRAIATDSGEGGAADDEAPRAAAQLDQDGLPIKGRLTGWINANGAHAYNCLHDHGQPDDVPWSLVYFAASGGDMEASVASSDGKNDSGTRLASRGLAEGPATAQTAAATDRGAAANAATDIAAGCLLLTTRPDPSSARRCYLEVRPTAGELWCFPGYMLHAVMPRKLRGEAGLLEAVGSAFDKRASRVSIACNVYMVSSADRDARIGHREGPGNAHRDACWWEGVSCMSR